MVARVGQQPSEQCLLSDNGIGADATATDDDSDPAEEKYLPPHNGGYNILFLDGHVKFVQLGKLKDLHPPLLK